MYFGSFDIMFKICQPVVQILTIKILQIIFQTSDVSISNGNIKYPIGTSIFDCKFDFKLFYVTVVVANIGSPKYYL